jgi:hypothetical protein
MTHHHAGPLVFLVPMFLLGAPYVFVLSRIKRDPMPPKEGDS